VNTCYAYAQFCNPGPWFNVPAYIALSSADSCAFDKQLHLYLLLLQTNRYFPTWRFTHCFLLDRVPRVSSARVPGSIPSSIVGKG